ncbi:MAG: dioxygenase family protein, partial [Anaerolineales bacterium]
MRKIPGLLFALSILTACANAPEPSAPTQLVPTQSSTNTLPASASTTEPDPTTPALTESVELSTLPAPVEDFFTQMSIALPVPTCNSVTQTQTEGPYYSPNTPERHSLLEEGMPGTRLILVGYVLDQNCQPLPNAWLDFWQADANGEYDNTGYRLRGHQFSDSQGLYYLETILPGLYSSRPIEHLHVKVQPEGGEVVTSQLYFPAQPIEGLTVAMEEKGDHLLGYFNFVVQ